LGESLWGGMPPPGAWAPPPRDRPLNGR
jgi:hypothetical protein